MSASWIVVAAVGAGTAALKATGPALLAHRELPVALSRVLELLAPALLAALVVTQTFADERELVLDARAVGVAAAAVAVALRAPLLAVVIVAAAVTAAVRAFV